MALGDVVDFYSGATPSKSESSFWTGGVPWFSAKDMKRPRLTDSADHVSDDVFKRTSLRRLPAGTVALVVRGMILAHTLPIAILDVDAAINQDLKALLPRADIDASFLAAMLRAQHSTILAQVSTAAHGTKKLDSRVLEQIRIPFPPLAEQRRTAAILDQAESLRARRRQVLTHFEALAKSILNAMLDAGSFPLVAAREFMPVMRNGLSPATAGEHSATVLTLSAITQGGFDPTAVKEGAFAYEPPPNTRVSASDFLICRGNGNQALVGSGVFSPVDRADLVFPDTVIAGQIDPDRVNLPYLNAVWKQPAVRRQLVSSARTTNGTYKINQQALSAILVPIPPLATQRAFADRMARISTERSSVIRAAAMDEELFASLQSRAFEGEL